MTQAMMSRAMKMTGSTMSMMAGVGREQTLADSVKAFAAARNGTLRMAAGLSDDEAAFRPDSQTWSVAQNLDHLLITESLYRKQIQQMLDLAREGRGRNINVSLRDMDVSLPFIPKAVMPLLETPLTVMNMFVPQALREAVLRFPVMKAKNPRISEPAPAKPLSVLRTELTESLAATVALLSGPLPAEAARVTVSHPLFGKNTIAGLVGLMTAHEERHGSQISRVLRQIPAESAA